jgi:hypothetical protein
MLAEGSIYSIHQPKPDISNRGLAHVFNKNTQHQVQIQTLTPEDASTLLQSRHCEIKPLTSARPAQSSEPILIPKLRIDLADFPYLHCSSDQRLLTLETCCGYGYGLARKLCFSLRFSRANENAPDTARAAVLFDTIIHISG